MKLAFGSTASTNAHLWIINGNEGSDLTIRNNLADTDGNGTTNPGDLILDNFKSVIVEDGTAALPSITFAGSAGEDSGLFYYEAAGGEEFVGITANGVVAAYFGENTENIYFYENTYNYYVVPHVDDSYDLGASSLRWDDVYATNTSIIGTSDIRLKEQIAPATLGLDFVNDLNPVSYKWIKKDKTGFNGKPKLEQTHYGIIAQEVMEVLKKYGINSVEDFGGITHDGGKDDYYGARYSEFIPILIKAVQELSAEVEELKEQN